MEIIQKDCDHYFEDGHPNVTNSLNQYTQSNGDIQLSHTGIVDWSADGATLMWMSSGFSRNLKTGKTHGEFGNGSYTLQNGHFILKSKFNFIDRLKGVETTSEQTYLCDMAQTQSKESSKFFQSPKQMRPSFYRDLN